MDVLIIWWCLLAIIRILLTVWPQPGYIHPDEFFQSLEISSGDIFGVNSLRTWEFNSSFPIRSIVPVYLTTGPALMLLRGLVGIGYTDALNSYTILVLPRLFMLLLSFLVDFSIFSIMSALRRNGKVGMVLVSSSYVTVVYYTRTFSNSLESVLFALLLHETLVENVSSISNFKANAEGKNIIRSSKKCVTGKSSVLKVAFIIVLGVFNRPTFAAFALVPYIYWLFRKNPVSGFPDVETVLSKAIGSLFSALFFAALFIVCDSIYFGNLSPVFTEVASTIQDVGLTRFLVTNVTVTPLNFLIYNIKPVNLASHGLHPRYTHVLVNIQILFGMLGMLVIRDIFRKAVNVFQTRKFSIDSLDTVVLFVYAVPLLLLSIFPHQEPRFLIPLLLPLVLLVSAEVFGSRSKLWLGFLWISFNILCCFFFGFFHQGGVIPAIRKLPLIAAADMSHAQTDVIFWRTYMPPRHLFLSGIHHSRQNYTEPVHRIHDLAGAPREKLLEILNTFNYSEDSSRVLLVSPGTVHRQLVCFGNAFQFEVLDQFWPHFSGEDLPTLDHLYCRNRESDDCESDAQCLSYSISERIYNAFSIYIYGVTVK